MLEGKFKIFVQDFFPIGSVTKSSAARFLHKNLVEKIKIFVQDFVTIKTGVTILLIIKIILIIILIIKIIQIIIEKNKNKNNN